MSNKYVDEIWKEIDAIETGESSYPGSFKKIILQAQLDGELTALENLKTDLVTYPERRVEWHVRNIDDRIEQINKLKAELGEQDE